MTALQLKQPGILFRMAVVGAQGNLQYSNTGKISLKSR